jgi:hypothetical protein
MKKKNEIKIGNDGYGSKNITISKENGYVEFSKTDPHNWGRVSQYFYLNEELIDDVITFLIKVKQDANLKVNS